MKIRSTLLSLLLFSIFLSSIAAAQTATIAFKVKLETDLPKGETVCVYLLEREGMGQQVVFPLTHMASGIWATRLKFTDGWLAVGVTYHYRYCRNYLYNGADEVIGGDQGYRTITIDSTNTVVEDTVSQWRWWPVDGKIAGIDTSAYLHTPPAQLPDSTFQCGVELPDYWDHPFINSVGPTLDRIVSACKANYIEYNPVPEITQFYPTPLINKEGVNGTSDSELVEIITEAKKRGLKVYLDPFAWSMQSDTSADYHTNEWWTAYEEQWRPIILDYAQIAQDYGVDVLTFGMWPSRWSVSQAEAPIVDSLAQNLLNDVKQIYTGKIAVEFTPWGPDLNLYKEADYLKFNISAFWPYQLSTSKSPIVSEMVTNLNTALDGLYGQSTGKWGKPILLSQIAASSYDGTVINQPDWEAELYYNPDDPSVPLDLQEQADAYEAFLQAFTQRSWIAGVYSFNYNYWNSIDKAPSIRSKPAERVVAKWYGWINPVRRTGTAPAVPELSSPADGAATPALQTKLNWKHSAAAASYRLVVSKMFTYAVNIFDQNNIADTAQNADSLNSLTTYYWRVAASNAHGTSGWSETRSFTTTEAASVNNSNPELPEQFYLSQNFPNPFNPSTVIGFGVPSSGSKIRPGRGGFVSLKVYDVLGRQVRTLVNEVKRPGNYEVQFDGRDLPSGVYFYRLTDGACTSTRKMLLLK